MAEVIYAGDAGNFKTCSKCGDCKKLLDFYRHAKGKSGVSSSCKNCSKEETRCRRRENVELVRETDRKRYAKNPKSKRLSASRYAKNNKEQKKAYHQSWRIKNAEKLRIEARERRLKNPDDAKDRVKKCLAKIRSTTKGRLEASVASGVRRGLIKGAKSGRRTFHLLNFTSLELKVHIERQFCVGMSWDNYGDWHIDHRIPLSSFNYDSPDDIDFKLAWSMTNLQPLWAKDNQEKSDKRMYLL